MQIYKKKIIRQKKKRKKHKKIECEAQHLMIGTRLTPDWSNKFYTNNQNLKRFNDTKLSRLLSDALALLLPFPPLAGLPSRPPR